MIGEIEFQVDHRIGFGTQEFLAMEEKASKNFVRNSRKLLAKDWEEFNVARISVKNDTINIKKSPKIDKYKTATTQKRREIQHALAQYVLVT